MRSAPPSPARAAFAHARAVLGAYRPDPARRPMVDAPSGAGDPLPAAPPRPGAPHLGSIAAVRAALASGSVTATELAERALALVPRAAALGALAAVEPDDVRARAAALDRLPPAARGPLHGIPVTVKDVIDVAGLPTTAGSAAYRTLPGADAPAVRLLREAGALILAKVTTHEFALGVTTPQARNPHDPDRTPGGSSGGSAVAVAIGFGMASLGTDTRASIRVPAALCGVTGLKATYGRVPTGGIVSLSWSMDHVGPLARTAADAATLLEVLAPATAGLAAWAGAPLAGARVGVPEALLEGAEPGVSRAVRDALGRLEARGAALVPSARPSVADLERAGAAGLVISRAEAAANHRSLGLDRALMWDETADQLDEADAVSAADYLDAQRLRAELAEGLAGALAGLWALAMPTTPCTAPPREGVERYLTVLSRHAIPWSLTGLPAISVPCGADPAGLPVGLQLVGRRGAEHLLTALGAAAEATAGLTD